MMAIIPDEPQADPETNCIINEVRSIYRVIDDITSKPPGTIERE